MSAAAPFPFWSDDFDMDLPKVIPEARERLGEYAGLELLTRGHTTHGRLNHPDCWNHSLGMVAFFGRPGHHYKESFFSTQSPEVRCTLWEAIRDVWVHDYVIVLEHNPIWNHPEMYNEHFYPLMSHLRGWSQLSEKEVKEHKLCVLDAIAQTRMLLAAHLERRNG